MHTHEQTEQFWRDWKRLSPDERRASREAVKDILDRPGLRVTPMRGADGIFEISWGIRDGSATFEYGEERTEGDPHIVWRRIGGHAIFTDP